MNDQQIQTETVESMEPHTETENVTQQQGVYNLVLFQYKYLLVWPFLNLVNQTTNN